MSHQRDTKEEAVAPGPGEYQAETHTIEKQVQAVRNRSEQQGPSTRFGTCAERVGWSRPLEQPFVDPYNIYNVPGPGHYKEIKAPGVFPAGPSRDKKDPEHAVPGAERKRFYGVHHPAVVMALQETQGPLQAFNSTDDRPCNKQVIQNTPAPWQYNKDEARGHSMNSVLRERAKVGRKGIFGTCADRFFGSPLAGREGLPDPRMEFEDPDKSSGAHADPKAVFQSQSPRFHSAPGAHEARATKIGNNETPAPGAYVVDKEPNYRSPYRTPRTEHLSFGSCKKRFDHGQDVFHQFQIPLLNPGPGDYDARNNQDLRKGSGAPKDKRHMGHQKVGCTTDQVGPGSYGSIETKMLKKTFNLTTQAPSEAAPPTRTPRKQMA